MKKITNHILLILLLALSTNASALDVSELDITVGGKAWFNSMELGELGKSDNISLMVGPSIMVRKDKFFAGGSFLFSLNDYEFSDSDTFKDSFGQDVSVNLELEVSRKDLDLIGGYTIHPNISLYAGYKRTALSNDIAAVAGNGMTSISVSSNRDSTISGFGIGIMGNKAINEKVVLFGSFGLLKMKQEGESLDGITLEFGASMPIKANLSASVSYKTQNLKYDDNSKLVFSGLAATINYTL